MSGCNQSIERRRGRNLRPQGQGGNQITLTLSTDGAFSEKILVSGNPMSAAGTWSLRDGDLDFDKLWIPQASAPESIVEADKKAEAGLDPQNIRNSNIGPRKVMGTNENRGVPGRRCGVRQGFTYLTTPSVESPLIRPSRFTISSMKLGELATQLGAELRGNPDLEITGVKGIEEAGPSEITFVANVRYTALARTT